MREQQPSRWHDVVAVLLILTPIWIAGALVGLVDLASWLLTGSVPLK